MSVASRRLLTVALLGSALSGEWVQAQPRVTAPYTVDFFEDGLPGQQVMDIEQTADGYLWVATNAGLARFDGHRFVTFDSSRTGIPDVAAILALHRSPQDTLFIVQNNGPIVSYAGGDSRRGSNWDPMSTRWSRSPRTVWGGSSAGTPFLEADTSSSLRTGVHFADPHVGRPALFLRRGAHELGIASLVAR